MGTSDLGPAQSELSGNCYFPECGLPSEQDRNSQFWELRGRFHQEFSETDGEIVPEVA